jgi:hypothetical protein
VTALFLFIFSINQNCIFVFLSLNLFFQLFSSSPSSFSLLLLADPDGYVTEYSLPVGIGDPFLCCECLFVSVYNFIFMSALSVFFL